MKSLRESILSQDYGDFASDPVLSIIYQAIDNLPKSERRFASRYIFDARSANAHTKYKSKAMSGFARSLKKIKGGKKTRFDADFFSANMVPGVAIIDADNGAMAMWDGKTVMLTRFEVIYFKLDEDPDETWTVLLEDAVGNIANSYAIEALANDYDGVDCTYFPCVPNMELVKKLMKTK